MQSIAYLVDGDIIHHNFWCMASIKPDADGYHLFFSIFFTGVWVMGYLNKFYFRLIWIGVLGLICLSRFRISLFKLFYDLSLGLFRLLFKGLYASWKIIDIWIKKSFRGFFSPPFLLFFLPSSFPFFSSPIFSFLTSTYSSLFFPFPLLYSLLIWSIQRLQSPC